MVGRVPTVQLTFNRQVRGRDSELRARSGAIRNQVDVLQVTGTDCEAVPPHVRRRCGPSRASRRPRTAPDRRAESPAEEPHPHHNASSQPRCAGPACRLTTSPGSAPAYPGSGPCASVPVAGGAARGLAAFRRASLGTGRARGLRAPARPSSPGRSPYDPQQPNCGPAAAVTRRSRAGWRTGPARGPRFRGSTSCSPTAEPTSSSHPRHQGAGGLAGMGVLPDLGTPLDQRPVALLAAPPARRLTFTEPPVHPECSHYGPGVPDVRAGRDASLPPTGGPKVSVGLVARNARTRKKTATAAAGCPDPRRGRTSVCARADWWSVWCDAWKRATLPTGG